MKMAKLVEQVLAIKLSKIVKDSEDNSLVISDEALATLLTSIPELAESVIDDAAVVVEVMELE
jgi:hypothetical protein